MVLRLRRARGLRWSEALIGGRAGAVVAHAGFRAFQWNVLGKKVIAPLVSSPTIGFLVAPRSWALAAALAAVIYGVLAWLVRVNRRGGRRVVP